ncbi:MAG: PaaI family thioesterase [Vulcanimicrobiaceae bacterium]
MLATTNFTAFGFRLVSAADGAACLHVPALPSNMRPGGIVAGYILIAAADVAVWLAIKTLFGIGDNSVTVDLHTAFLASTSSDVVCEARIVRSGRRIVTGVATCSDDTRQLAQHTVTYARRD